MSDSEAKTRTITLSDRPPVVIREDRWPMRAEAEIHNSRNGIDRDWTRRHLLFLRCHADGRMILYGKYQTKWQGERDLAGGEMLEAGADVRDAAYRVAEVIGYEGHELVRLLLADMPAETLD